MRFRQTLLGMMIATGLGVGAGVCGPGAVVRAEAGRQAAGESSPDAVRELQHMAIKSESALERRRAVRRLAELGGISDDLLGPLMADSDEGVRRTVVMSLDPKKNLHNLSTLQKALDDDSSFVRQAAAHVLVAEELDSTAVLSLLEKALADESAVVRGAAARALWWSYEPMRPTQERADLDYELAVSKVIDLAHAQWALRIDFDQQGHLESWYEEEKEGDSDWQSIEDAVSGEAFDQWDASESDSVAVWYRGVILLPERPRQEGTDLVISATSGSTWIWINGDYLGQQLEPGEGFRSEVTDRLRWGEENRIVIRVLISNRDDGKRIVPKRMEVLTRR